MRLRLGIKSRRVVPGLLAMRTGLLLSGLPVVRCGCLSSAVLSGLTRDVPSLSPLFISGAALIFVCVALTDFCPEFRELPAQLTYAAGMDASALVVTLS